MEEIMEEKSYFDQGCVEISALLFIFWYIVQSVVQYFQDVAVILPDRRMSGKVEKGDLQMKK